MNISLKCLCISNQIMLIFQCRYTFTQLLAQMKQYSTVSFFFFQDPSKTFILFCKWWMTWRSSLTESIVSLAKEWQTSQTLAKSLGKTVEAPSLSHTHTIYNSVLPVTQFYKYGIPCKFDFEILFIILIHISVQTYLTLDFHFSFQNYNVSI